MTMTLEQVSNRFEIQDLLVEYSRCIDMKDFDGLDTIFTKDAFIDYTEMGGIKGAFPEVKKWLSEVMPMFSSTQHLISNYEIALDGDKATGKIMCFNPQVLKAGDKEYTMFLGLWYLDQYIKTADGWRICQRIEEKSYDYNTPDFMKIAAK